MAEQSNPFLVTFTDTLTTYNLVEIQRFYNNLTENKGQCSKNERKALVKAVRGMLKNISDPDQRCKIIDDIGDLHTKHVLRNHKITRVEYNTVACHYMDGTLCYVSASATKLTKCCTDRVTYLRNLLPLAYRPEWSLERELSVVDLQFFERFKHSMPWPDVVYVAIKTRNNHLVDWLFNPDYSGFNNLYTFCATEEVREYLDNIALILLGTKTTLGLVACCILDGNLLKNYVELNRITLAPEVKTLMSTIIKNNATNTEKIYGTSDDTWAFSFWVDKPKNSAKNSASFRLSPGNPKGYRTSYLNPLQTVIDM